MRIDSVKCRAIRAATPSDRTIERTPTPSGRSAATTLPNARRRRRRVNGSTRSSAERASAELARRRSRLSGASPVQPSHASGSRRSLAEDRRRLAQARQQRLDGLASGVEATRSGTRRSCRGTCVVLVERGEHAGDSRDASGRRRRSSPGRPPARLAERGQPLGDEDHAIRERRAEAVFEVVADLLRLSARHPRRDLETVLEMARRRDEDRRGDRPDHDDRPAVAHDARRPARQPRRRGPGVRLQRPRPLAVAPGFASRRLCIARPIMA